MSAKILDQEKRTAILKIPRRRRCPARGWTFHRVLRWGARRKLAASVGRARADWRKNDASVGFVVGRLPERASSESCPHRGPGTEVRRRASRHHDRTETSRDPTGSSPAYVSELMKNLSTRGRPDGGALANLIERWVGDIAHEVTSVRRTGYRCSGEAGRTVQAVLNLVGGYDFQRVARGILLKGFSNTGGYPDIRDSLATWRIQDKNRSATRPGCPGRSSATTPIMTI